MARQQEHKPTSSLGDTSPATQSVAENLRLKLDRILLPEGDIGDLDLADILDIPAIQSLMDDFHQLAHIPMALIDLKGKVLVGVGWQDICTRFHRVHPETCQHCIESDTQLTAGVNPGEFRLYKCKNNMWDVSTPIMVGGQHVGNLFSGQFFFEGEPLDVELFRSQATRYGFDEAGYLAALAAVPRLSRETVNTGMGFFVKLAQMLSQSSYSNIKLARSLAERDALMDSLRQNEQWLRVTLSSIGDAVIASNTAGRVTFLNPVAETLTGWSPEEALGQPIQSVFKIINEQTRQPAEDIVGRVLRDGCIIELANHTALVTQDGREIPIEDSAAPITDAAGNVAGVVLVFHDVTERRRAQEQLELLARFPQENPNPVLRIRQDGRRIYSNPAGLVLTEAWGILCGERVTGKAWDLTAEALAANCAREWEFTCNDRIYLLNFVPLKDLGYVNVYGRDITERRRQEEELHKLTRTLKAINSSNQALLHASDESTLLQEACKIVVEDCGHAMVWIGYAENDEARTVRPVAYSGFEQGYLENQKFTWDDSEHGRGPTGTAIRTGQPSICRSMLTDPRLKPWREQAVTRGYASSIVLPLLENGNAFGALTIYSREADPFSADEVKLLTELAADLAYGISAIRLRATHAQAEEALHQNEDRLRLAIESAELGTWDFDPVTGALEWSDQCKAMFGLPPDAQVDYPTFLNLMHPADRQRVHEVVQQALDPAGSGLFDTEYRALWPDGTERWIIAVGRAFFGVVGGQSQAVRFIGTVLDVTDRKRSEAVMRRYELLAGHSRDMILFVRRKDGHILEANTAATQIYGYSREELLSLKIHELRMPDTQELTIAQLAEADTVGILFETIHQRKDGSTFPVEVSSRGATIDGERTLISMIRDITARKKSEEALRLRNERLALLSEAAAHLLKADDSDKMVLNLFKKVSRHLDVHAYFNFMVNEAGDALRLDSCAGIPDEVARSIERLEFGVAVCGTVAVLRQAIHATQIQQSADAKVQLIKGFGIRAYACNPLMAGDRLLGTLSFASRTKDRFDEDELEFMRTICQYVAMAKERLRLEKELREHLGRLAENDQRKDEFLAMLAHELRNPLAPVRNSVQVLRMIGAHEPILVRQHDIIDRQVTHMARLLDDLLDVSRITQGKIELKKQPLQLSDVLAHAVETATPLIETRRHTLSVTLPPDDIRVEADLDRLAQVVGNLLVNAAKYSDEGGQIWLEAVRKENSAVIHVRDTGMGIAPDILPRIFDLFAQADQTLARSRGGLGIGLTMVKRLVEMHKGMVEAHSEGLGRGSEFIIHLPALPDAAPTPAQPAKGPKSQAFPAPHGRIMVVDDVVDSSESLAELLRLWGYAVSTAHNGPQALEMARQLKPEVVLLDIGMPGMNGFEVARRLREQQDGHPLFLVALTGYTQESDRQIAYEAGFDTHLAKPVDLAALRDLLARTSD